MTGRIVIDDVRPRTPSGTLPAKAVVGEVVTISADVFRDGHDTLGARVRWWDAASPEKAQTVEMRVAEPGLDRWSTTIIPTSVGLHCCQVDAWTDDYETWRHKAEVKGAAGQEIDTELAEAELLIDARIGAASAADKSALQAARAALGDRSVSDRDQLAPLLAPEAGAVLRGPGPSDEMAKAPCLSLWVDRERALVGAWYEFFPRSEGGLAGARDRLAAVAEMGFDVVYFPPIHPIGRSHRKGPNNTLMAGPDDPGSPWAIGGPDGGHDAIDPTLGTFTDFEMVVAAAKNLGMEIALDYALQCSPDHPWVTAHPEWFHTRPDGSIAYAENPPKKYQDIYPINFWPDTEADRVALWEACRDILDFWIERGVHIFRVDNPHTKPLAFWEWVIDDVRQRHPEIIFLAEAFTRPKVMAKLAEVGFTQSYTYFTWRTGRDEIVHYVEEVAHSSKADFMRPNFWPNTPDILSGPLRNGTPAAFRLRFLLAATLVPSYGIYSGFELFENEPMSDQNEEYFHSEKYELRTRDWSTARTMAPFIAEVNQIRRSHPALQRLRNIRFHYADNDQVIAYSKVSDDGDDVMLVIVNLDPWHAQEATLGLDLAAMGIPPDARYEAYDELSRQAFQWQGPNPWVRLDPNLEQVAHLLHLRRQA
ncbi:MAG: alpha-1,4-glucan--maltose-1-phosphate maltosyltransferase [Acidimicrobiales bacterium]